MDNITCQSILENFDIIENSYNKFEKQIKNLKKDNNELKKKLMIEEKSKIDITPKIYHDNNGIKHYALSAEIEYYLNRDKKILLSITDISNNIYSKEELKDNLENKHPGNRICNNFTLDRFGISNDCSPSLYINPKCNKYKDIIRNNLILYSYSDNDEHITKFKQNNPEGTLIILNVVY